MPDRPAVPPRDEARRELSSILSGGPLDDLGPQLFVDHLLAAYPDAAWPVLRDAARALLRRVASADREGLRVGGAPGGKRWRGHYTTRRGRSGARPYATLLVSLRPLQVSCDCLDYQMGSLGVCKHGIAVLRGLARPRRQLARVVEAGPWTRGPAVWWHPIRPLEGGGDWLEGVRIRADAELDAPTRRVLVPDEEGGQYRPDVARLRSDAERTRLVEALDGLRPRGRPRDPAIAAWTSRERAQLARAERLRLTKAEVRRFLRTFRLKLYPYQRRALDEFLKSGRTLLADDMGLGKTVQAAAIGHTLHAAGKIRRILILAPASLKSQWVREWRRATHVPIEPVDGPPPDRRRLYASTKTGALVANYEQVFRDLDLMRQWSPDLVVLDEAQRIKNWATQTAGRVKQLDVPYRLVLTGTPMENRLDELASIMDWVDPFVMAPKWRIGAAHTITVDGEREVIGVRRLDVLRTRLAPRMLRRRRSEILKDLPERTDCLRTVAMTEAQQHEHDELSPAIAKLARIAQRRALTQAEFLRLMSLLTTQRVIANGLAQLRFESIWPGLRDRPVDEATLATLSMPKLSHLRDLVESVVVDQGRKVVVFSQWKRALSLAGWAIRDLLEGAGVRAAFFTGDESQRRRTRNVIDFHDEPDLRVLFCTDAGGVGLNLQRAASACVQIELPWNPAVFEQRVARLHRLGQPDPVDVYTLLSEGSIEARIAGAVANKRAMFTGLFDGDTDAVTFEGSGGFLAAVQAVVEPAAATIDVEDDDPDAGVVGDGDHVEDLVASADEVADEPAVPRPLPSAPGLPDAAQVRQMFAELRVEPKPDGGLHLDASPEAARTLGALFAGMASLLESAASSRSPDSTRRS